MSDFSFNSGDMAGISDEKKVAPSPVAKQMAKRANVFVGGGTAKTLGRMTQEQAHEFLLMFMEDRVVTNGGLPPRLVPLVFEPIGSGALVRYGQEELTKNLAFVFAYRGQDETPSRTQVNGIPVFARCRLMHRDDWAVIHPLIQQATADRGGSPSKSAAENHEETKSPTPRSAPDTSATNATQVIAEALRNSIGLSQESSETLAPILVATLRASGWELVKHG